MRGTRLNVTRILAATALIVGVEGCSGPASESGDGGLANASGKQLYELNCAACHEPGPGHPGTMMLAAKGQQHPALVDRTDLDPEYVKQVVRNGLIEMPPFRPTELTDAQLDALVRHIQDIK